MSTGRPSSSSSRRAPRSSTVVVLVLLLGVALAGCGGDSSSGGSSKVSKAALECRAQWKRLGEGIDEQTRETNPSGLPDRWNTVAATVDYYRTAATGKGCSEKLDAQQMAISSLKSFSTQLTPYDMQAQLALVTDDATAYAAGPWPKAPKASAKGGKKKAESVRPPKPALVGAALETLTAQAPLATEQQGPGWQQASVIDLDDPAAKAKAVKDLRFLSTVSSGWRASTAALATIKLALDATG